MNKMLERHQYSMVFASCQYYRFGSYINMFAVKNIKSTNSHMKKVMGKMDQNFQRGPDSSVITEKIMVSQNKVCCEVEYPILLIIINVKKFNAAEEVLRSKNSPPSPDPHLKKRGFG